MTALALLLMAQTAILPLGDSLTLGVGSPSYGGYRVALEVGLVSAGVSFDFVGNHANGPASLVDKHHQGVSGLKIADLTASAPNVLAAHRPAIVLLLVGTNDIIGRVNPAGMPARLATLLATIHAHAPDATVLLMTLPPVDWGNNAGWEIFRAQVAAYNAAMPDVVASRVAAGQDVRLVEAPALGVGDFYGAGVHHNQTGSDKLAAAWLPAVVEVATNAPTIRDRLAADLVAALGLEQGAAEVAASALLALGWRR